MFVLPSINYCTMRKYDQIMKLNRSEWRCGWRFFGKEGDNA